MLAQRMQVVTADVFAVDEQLAGLEFVKTGNQTRDGSFSGPGMSDDGDVFPFADVQAEVIQHGITVGITKREVIEINSPAVIFRIVSAGLDDGMFGVNQREYPFSGG